VKCSQWIGATNRGEKYWEFLRIAAAEISAAQYRAPGKAFLQIGSAELLGGFRLSVLGVRSSLSFFLRWCEYWHSR